MPRKVKTNQTKRLSEPRKDRPVGDYRRYLQDRKRPRSRP